MDDDGAQEEIGNKSLLPLLSGAAMPLALSHHNYSKMKIMILGRWWSNDFMAYIRPQIINLTSNLAEDMVDVSVTDCNTHGVRGSYDHKSDRRR